MHAAVLRAPGDRFVVDEVRLRALGPDDVRVRLAASGVCHSDLSIQDGTIPHPLPAVLGHEGAGEVVEVGPGVTDLTVGDHVVVVWVPPCGKCNLCMTGQANLCTNIMFSAVGASPHFRLGGDPVFGMAGTGTFSEQAVLPQ